MYNHIIVTAVIFINSIEYIREYQPSIEGIKYFGAKAYIPAIYSMIKTLCKNWVNVAMPKAVLYFVLNSLRHIKVCIRIIAQTDNHTGIVKYARKSVMPLISIKTIIFRGVRLKLFLAATETRSAQTTAENKLNTINKFCQLLYFP